MQDSSTNPYIPQENQQIRTATQTLSSPLKRTVKILMIVTLVLAVAIGAGLFFVIPRTEVADNGARVDLANTLQPPAQLSKVIPVKSSVGFTLKYDNQMFTSYAETTAPVDKNGKQGSSAYYENDDLRTPRDYTLVRITPAESSDSDRAAVADPPQLVVSTPYTVADLKANEDKPDYKGLSQLSLFVQLSSDKRLAAKTADDGTTVSIDATKPSSQTINGVKYQKVRYTTKNENYRIVNQKYDDCYYTIQNDTPVSACVINVRPTSRDDAALNEKTLQSLTYQKTDTATKSDEADSTAAPAANASDKADTAAQPPTSEEQLPLETPKPEYSTNFASLAAIAKNQPSAVRIGTLYCADLNLKVASGEVITTLTDACAGNLASGTIVSKDGYIATTGHAIRYDPKAAINGYIGFAENQKDLLDRLDRVLDYLLKARLILESDAEYLKTGAQIGDQEALAKIENIGSVIPDNYVTATKDNYSYAIQPTDKPLVIDSSTGARPTFAYSDTVIEAKFVAANYDTDRSSQNTFDSPTPKNDVGLLKSDGSFQNVILGKGSAVTSNGILNIIGYPSFSDSSLVIGKSQNMPVITHGKVNQTYEKDGQQLTQIDAPVVPGTDGGGTFDQSGRLVGFGVYGLSYCPDQQCFSTGTIRSVDELTLLLESKNMKLGSASEATVAWQQGIDAYFKSDYATASSHFAKAESLYSFNQLAAKVKALSDTKKGSASDTSLMNQLVTIMITVLIIMIILTLVFAIIFILQKRRLDTLRVGHYGNDATPPVQQPQPFVPAQPQAQQSYQQQPAQQPQPYQPTPASQIPPQYQQQSQPPVQPTTQYPQYQQPQVPQQYGPPQPQQPPMNNGQTPEEDPFYKQ